MAFFCALHLSLSKCTARLLRARPLSRSVPLSGSIINVCGKRYRTKQEEKAAEENSSFREGGVRAPWSTSSLSKFAGSSAAIFSFFVMYALPGAINWYWVRQEAHTEKGD